ncbi:MAG: molybdopterin-dependent oxidoreductase [Actinomycetota bacterium]
MNDQTTSDPAQADTGPATTEATTLWDFRGVPAWLAAIVGLVAAGSALAAGELAASFAAPQPGPVIAVANRVVDNAPNWFVEFGKSVFGLADKPALVLGTIIISLLIGTAVGVLSRSRPTPAVITFAGFGLLGMLAIGVDAQGGWGLAIVAAIISVVAGLAALYLLFRATTEPVGAQLGLRPAAGASGRADTPTNPAVSRRRFLNWSGLIGVGAIGAGVMSRDIRARSSAAKARAEVELAEAATTEIEAVVSTAAEGPVASTPGITPLIIPNDEFYLIDTALTTPQVDPANWSMTIRGMVDNEMTYTYDELLDRAKTIAPVTLSCVSNEVGGDLVGNAVWQGVPLVELLDEAGVQPGATQIASRSVDGWNCGFPTEAAYDGRTALVAVGMNGEPLPLRHGFPARLVVSGLYGYVSATKWLKEIELTTIEDFNGYWIPRGWSKLGPVKTQSRIDTPRHTERVTAGTEVPIAGVAWAPDTGITKVEVQVGDGPWMEATLGESLGPDAWVQWLVSWTAVAGRHVVQVRATDGTGTTQTEQPTPPAPNGASGWHRIGVEAV